MALQVTGIKVRLMGSSESEELRGGNRYQKGSPQTFPNISKCKLSLEDKPRCWENESGIFKHSMAGENLCFFREPDKDHTCSGFPCTDPNCPFKNRDHGDD